MANECDYDAKRYVEEIIETERTGGRMVRTNYEKANIYKRVGEVRKPDDG